MWDKCKHLEMFENPDRVLKVLVICGRPPRVSCFLKNNFKQGFSGLAVILALGKIWLWVCSARSKCPRLPAGRLQLVHLGRPSVHTRRAGNIRNGPIILADARVTSSGCPVWSNCPHIVRVISGGCSLRFIILKGLYIREEGSDRSSPISNHQRLHETHPNNHQT